MTVVITSNLHNFNHILTRISHKWNQFNQIVKMYVYRLLKNTINNNFIN